MAEKIYTLEQAAAKLGKKPDEFREFAKQNNISELRKGSNILYNAKDVDALEASGSDDTVLSIEDSVIGLGDESSLLGIPTLDEKDDDEEFEIDADMSSMVELTEADTRAGLTGVDDENAEDSILSLADSVTEEEPEAKINADEDIDSGGADGSGSGLLDLSLQADDSQFGAVLDDILPGGDNEGGGFDDFSDHIPSSGDDFAAKVKAEKEEESEEEDTYAPEPAVAAAPGLSGVSTAAPGAVVYQQVAADDPASGTFGVMMLLPVLAIVLAMIVVTAGFKSVTPSILSPIEDYLLYVIGGLALLALVIGIVGSVAGSGGGEKKPKPVKVKATKKPKKK